MCHSEQCMWKPEGSFGEPAVLYFGPSGPRDGTQVFGFGGKHLYQLSCLAGLLGESTLTPALVFSSRCFQQPLPPRFRHHPVFPSCHHWSNFVPEMSHVLRCHDSCPLQICILRGWETQCLDLTGSHDEPGWAYSPAGHWSTSPAHHRFWICAFKEELEKHDLCLDLTKSGYMGKCQVLGHKIFRTWRWVRELPQRPFDPVR